MLSCNLRYYLIAIGESCNKIPANITGVMARHYGWNNGLTSLSVQIIDALSAVVSLICQVPLCCDTM